MSAPAFASKLQAARIGGKGQRAPGKPKPTRPAGKQRPMDDDDDDDDSSSSGEDSDAEIGLTADANVKATVKPITDSAKPASVAASKSAAPKGKKRKAEANDDDDDDGDDTPGDGGAELIDVEFGIYDPKPIDYLTTKMLLKDYVVPGSAAGGKKKKKKAAADAAAMEESDGAAAAAAAASAPSTPDADFALHELCDAIVEQAAVGSMVKGEGTEEPLGFLTALSLDWQQTYAKNIDGVKGACVWIDQLRKYIVGRAPAALKDSFQQALASRSTGLLLQGRLINVPPQIIPQLHESLLLDLAWARAHAGAYGQQFDFDRLVLIARKFKPPPGSKPQARQDVLAPTQFAAPLGAGGGKKKKRKGANGEAQAASNSAGGGDEYEWLRFEEELYARAATAQFEFHVPFTEEDAAAGRQPQSCVVMIVPMKKLPEIVQELQMMAAMS